MHTKILRLEYFFASMSFFIIAILLVTSQIAHAEYSGSVLSNMKKKDARAYVCSKTFNGVRNSYYSKGICDFCSNTRTSDADCLNKVSSMIRSCASDPMNCESAKAMAPTSMDNAYAAVSTVEPSESLYVGEPQEPEYSKYAAQLQSPQAASPELAPVSRQNNATDPAVSHGGLYEEFQAMMGGKKIASEIDMKNAVENFAEHLRNKEGSVTMSSAQLRAELGKIATNYAWGTSQSSGTSAQGATNTPTAAGGEEEKTLWCTSDAECGWGRCCRDSICMPCPGNPAPQPEPQPAPEPEPQPEQPPEEPRERSRWPICDGPSAELYMANCSSYAEKSDLYRSWNVMGAKGGIRMPYANRDGMAVRPERINIFWEGPEAEVHYCLCQGGTCDNTGCVMPADGSGDPDSECPGNYVELPEFKCDEPSKQQVADACGITALSSAEWPAIAGTHGKLIGGYCTSLRDTCDYVLSCPNGVTANVSTPCTH